MAICAPKKEFETIVKSKDLSLVSRKTLCYFDTEKKLFCLQVKAEHEIGTLENNSHSSFYPVLFSFKK